jgi:hypothetical protein
MGLRLRHMDVPARSREAATRERGKTTLFPRDVKPGQEPRVSRTKRNAAWGEQAAFVVGIRPTRCKAAHRSSLILPQGYASHLNLCLRRRASAAGVRKPFMRAESRLRAD